MRNLIAFLRRFQIFLVFVILQIAALYFYITFFSFPRSQYLSASSQFAGTIWSIRNDITKQFSLGKTVTDLQRKNRILRERLPMSFIQLERAEFKINDTLFGQQYEYIEGDVVQSNVTRRNNYFTINVGRKQGIKKNMGVFSDNGVVGVIHSVSEHYSIVKSLLTSNANVDVEIIPSGLNGLVKWDGVDPRRGSVAGISNDLKIKKWSVIQTRGGAGIFPRGIPVGKVEKLKSVEGQAFWDVSFVFAEDFRSVQKIYVVKNILRNEQLKLEETIPADPIE